MVLSFRFSFFLGLCGFWVVCMRVCLCVCVCANADAHMSCHDNSNSRIIDAKRLGKIFENGFSENWISY